MTQERKLPAAFIFYEDFGNTDATDSRQEAWDNVKAEYVALRDKLAAAEAALFNWHKYDRAICKRGAEGEYVIDPKGAIAEGEDLDTLYFNAKTAMDEIIKETP